MSALRQWTVCKDDETLVFRYRAGDEGRLLAEIAEQAASGRLGLNDTDVEAVVSEIIRSIPPGESASAVMISIDQAAAGAS